MEILKEIKEIKNLDNMANVFFGIAKEIGHPIKSLDIELKESWGEQINKSLSKTKPSLSKDCPECSGRFKGNYAGGMIIPDSDSVENCKTCKGTGKIS